MHRVEHIVRKGEIARFEQFQLWSQCFQKPSAAEASESVCIWERVDSHLIGIKSVPTSAYYDLFIRDFRGNIDWQNTLM